MNNEWRTFLQDAGAEFSAGFVDHFGNPAIELQVTTSGNIIADLSHLGIISASGKDVLSFLQGQLTNDLSLLHPGCCQLNGYCSPQGRLLTLFNIFLLEETYYLQLPAELLNTMLERLKKYILMSKLSLSDYSENLVRIGFSGPQSETELASLLSNLPTETGAMSLCENIAIIRLSDTPYPRFELIGDAGEIQKIWMALDVRAAPVGREAWELLDIIAGIPVIYPDTTDKYIPQMVNLHLLNGLSFKKGCYPGQEIVARLQYRGTLKRQMTRAHINSHEAIPAGSSLMSPDEEQSIGSVVSARPSPDGGYEALIVIQNEYANSEKIYLKSDHGASIIFKGLPYPHPLN